MINQYRFGSIIIDGKTYNQDVMIFDHEVLDWPKAASHLVAINEIEEALKRNPKVIIFGTGENRLMEVPHKVQSMIRERGIELIIKDSSSARKEFNNLIEKGKKVVGLFHLTC